MVEWVQMIPDRDDHDLRVKEGAALALALRHARKILDGDIALVEGARLIWWESFNPLYDRYLEGNELIDRLAVFVALADDWEEAQDNFDSRRLIDQQIIEATRALVDLARDRT